MMQALERSTAVFCIACICAELLSRFVGPGWGQKCIKAVAGLYILVVFADALPGAGAQLPVPEMPQTAAVSVGDLEDIILLQTEAALSETLSESCREETGVSVTLDITLHPTSEGVEASGVSLTPQGECGAAQRQAVERFLSEQLQLGPECIVWKEPGGEDVP